MNAWDYIIIGAGSAGCVLANRLSARSDIRVLLIEAGGTDRAAKFNVVALGAIAAIGHPDSDWMLPTEADPSRLGQADVFPRGKVLGGSSAINGTIYVRGNRGDYDHWAALGNRGWGYDSLIPIFRRMEDASGNLARSEVYGHGGPMKISETRGPHPLAHRFVDAMGELGVPKNSNYNGEHQTGAAITHVTQRRGWRWSTARGYLYPAMSRPNLRVLTGAVARRVVFEGRRAVGVEFDHAGRRVIERCAGEVVISASTFNSPKLLMLSGIGDAQHLKSHGIEIVHANSHVGQNLQEHAVCMVKGYVSRRTENLDTGLFGKTRQGLRFALFGSGPATYVFPAVSFVKLRPESEYPDLQFHFGAFIADVTPSGVQLLKRSGVTVMPNVNRSRSRGYVKLKSADPDISPEIQPNLLGDSRDLETLIAGVRIARGVFKTRAFSKLFVGEHAPGPSVVSDYDLEQFVRANAAPGYHASGTVKMGVDATAVVDPELRVIGVEKLRVVDASIIPQVPSGNINAITMVIGEQGAAAILRARHGSA